MGKGRKADDDSAGAGAVEATPEMPKNKKYRKDKRTTGMYIRFSGPLTTELTTSLGHARGGPLAPRVDQPRGRRCAVHRRVFLCNALS